MFFRENDAERRPTVAIEPRSPAPAQTGRPDNPLRLLTPADSDEELPAGVGPGGPAAEGAGHQPGAQVAGGEEGPAEEVRHDDIEQQAGKDAHLLWGKAAVWSESRLKVSKASFLAHNTQASVGRRLWRAMTSYPLQERGGYSGRVV